MPGKRGPKISPAVKQAIYEAAVNEPKKDRRLLAVELQEKLLKSGIRTVPSEETMERMISSARNSGDHEDRPWTVSALADYDIPPQALPAVMDMWAKRLELGSPLTVRQAKWIARLYHVLKHADTQLLWESAFMYAQVERVTRPTYKYPEKPEDAWPLWLRDARLYFTMTGDDELYRKCREHVPAEWLLVDSMTLEVQRVCKPKEEDD